MLFFLSGAAGLIYEIAWERLLELYFGVTMTSITLIVASYMCGLGLGSLLGGHIAQKLKRPVLIYGLIEAAIGIFGFFSTGIINWVGQQTAGAPYIWVFLLSFIILLIPTLLMGMTLPLLIQSFVDRVETSGQVIGLLYGINTLGAATGSLLAGYILIASFGFNGTVFVAAFLNVGVALIAIVFAEWIGTRHAAEQEKQNTITTTGNWSYRQILFASFLVGFIGLGFEMVWIRILYVINKNSSYGFPSILFIFLSGLALGGYFWGRRADRAGEPEKLFWKIEVAGGLTAAFVLLFFWTGLSAGWPPWLGDFFEMQRPSQPFTRVEGTFLFSKRLALTSLVDYFLPILLMVFPASFILGGGLPVLDRIAVSSPEVAGRRVGDIHLANIAGSIFGSLFISFWMLPRLSSESTYKTLVLLGLTFPILHFASKYKNTNRLQLDPVSVSLIGALVLTLFMLPGKGQLYARLFKTGTGNQSILLETSDSVLAFTIDPVTQAPHMLWIGGEINSLYPSDLTYESRALMCAGASQPKRILVVGMGGGVAAHFFQSMQSAREIVIVEIMAGLDDLLSESIGFSREIFDDPRVHYIVNDARRYLYANPDEKFDLIFADPLRWHSTGHNNLYSVEMLHLYRSHLNEDGVFCAFVDERHIIPHTAAQVFPAVDQFDLGTMVASNQEIIYDLLYMQAAADQYSSETSHTLTPHRLFSNYVRDRDQILVEEIRVPVLTDLKPGLEYYFLNAPIRTPIRSKGNIEKLVLNRISGCDTFCQQSILELVE
ncbi:MAG TPA: fused MFS/spermidine synthase [Anaerolineales bacterium]|nr:fused MFS/spermidine synthase [Anaerolineales bacterium]